MPVPIEEGREKINSSAQTSPLASETPFGMKFIPGGAFLMGSDRHYPEEAPVRKIAVDDFWIDETPVTNAQFAAFVAATGHRTCAEIAPDPAQYPSMPEHMRHAGSLVFKSPGKPVPLTDPYAWWDFCFGTSWRCPEGPGSSIEGRENHPVVHIAYADADAYTKWSGKSLPTEAEFEFAARGGLAGAEYAWGNELAPGGLIMANYWIGDFPYHSIKPAGQHTTSPVRQYPANGYGLFDMIGNVWEWTSDWYRADASKKSEGSCCIPQNPRGGAENESYDPAQPDLRIGRKVLKGGSHLCAPSYCRRYRPAARYPQPVDTSTSHVGFRCVLRARSHGKVVVPSRD